MMPECVLIVGPSGCGKTWTLLHEVLRKQYYDYIIIVCPTLSYNDTYRSWNGLSDRCVFEVELSPTRLSAIITFIIKHFNGEKTAVVIDDMSSSNEQHKNFGKVNYLAYSGRHHGISLFLLSQKLSSVSTGVRDNATRVVFFPTHCKRSLKTLRDEFFGHLTLSQENHLLAQLKDYDTHYIDIDLAEKTYVRKVT